MCRNKKGQKMFRRWLETWRRKGDKERCRIKSVEKKDDELIPSGQVFAEPP